MPIPVNRKRSMSYILEHDNLGATISNGPPTKSMKNIHSPTRGSAGKMSTSAVIRSLINNGLLCDDVKWVLSAIAAHSVRNCVGSSNREKTAALRIAVDEDGTLLLMLAISLGCSDLIIWSLISYGAHVSDNELLTAAFTNQPNVLSVLLDYYVCLPGTIDLNQCSVAVTRVLEAAAEGQAELEKKMRERAEEFIPVVLDRLLRRGLSTRRLQTPNDHMCSRSVSFALVGNVLLSALHEHQCKTFPLQKSMNMEAKDNNSSTSHDTGRFLSGSSSVGSGTPPGLLYAIPSPIFKNALFRNMDGNVSIITYLLLVEDFLCSQSIDNASVGLALFRVFFEKISVSGLKHSYG